MQDGRHRLSRCASSHLWPRMTNYIGAAKGASTCFPSPSVRPSVQSFRYCARLLDPPRKSHTSLLHAQRIDARNNKSRRRNTTFIHSKLRRAIGAKWNHCDKTRAWHERHRPNTEIETWKRIYFDFWFFNDHQRKATSGREESLLDGSSPYQGAHNYFIFLFFVPEKWNKTSWKCDGRATGVSESISLNVSCLFWERINNYAQRKQTRIT